jgi:hypothetical protein
LKPNGRFLARETGWKKQGEDYPIVDFEGVQVVEFDESSTWANVFSHSLDREIQSLLAKPHRQAAVQSHVSSAFSEFTKSLGSLLGVIRHCTVLLFPMFVQASFHF